MIDPGFIGFAAVGGACVGSACVTAVIRSTQGLAFVSDRSRCDQCGVQLGFLRTVPIVSFVIARGACHKCGGEIAPLHLVGEIAGGLIAAVAVMAPSWIQVALLACLGFTLLCSAAFDLRTLRLPDILTAIVAVTGAILSFVEDGRNGLVVSLVCAAITFGGLQALRSAFRLRSGEPGLGFGDVKLAASLALWVGPAICAVLAIASLVGLVVFRIRKGETVIPFGPMLAGSAWLVGSTLTLSGEGATLWMT